MVSGRQRRDAEQFASALEREGPDRSALPDEVAGLIALAESVDAAATVEPSPHFAARLRADLMSEARTVLIDDRAIAGPAAEDRTVRRRRRLATALVCALVVGGGAGLVTSSASALPGEMLYPIKRGIESAQSVLRSGESAQGSYDLERAMSRLSETTELVAASGSSEHISISLDEFASLSRSGAERLIAVHGETGSTEPLAQLADFTVAATEQLAALEPLLPSPARSAWVQARNTLRTLSDTVGTLCAACDNASFDALAAVGDIVGHSTEPESGPPSSGAKLESGKEEPDTSGDESHQGEKTKDEPKAPSDDTPKTSKGDKPAPDRKEPATSDEEETKDKPGLLSPITGLLFGDGDSSGLLGGLLGGKK